MPREALIVYGGWEGHQPRKVAGLMGEILREEGFAVELSDSLDVFRGDLANFSLIVPHWTMGRITPEQLNPVLAAVGGGVGLAGCHGGMCDAFRDSPEWQFMTGGQWVAHPGNDRVTYSVHVSDASHPITQGISDFQVTTEQYYMHIDPATKVLATTRFPTAPGPHTSNGPVDMPVVWTKMYGQGKVFYDSLGHSAALVRSQPNLMIMRRGFAWAAR